MTTAPAAGRSRRRLAGLLMVGAVLGKLLGLVREVTMARVLGATFIVDGFRGGLTAVMLPIAVFQGDVVPAILIPLNRVWREQGEGPRKGAALCAVFYGGAAILALLVSLFADPWVSLLVGGFSPEAHAVTVQFVRVMSLAMPAISLFNALSSVEIAFGRSRITSLRSSVQNVTVIVGIIVAAATGAPIAIGWAFAIGLNATAFFGLWRLWREGELDPSGVRPALILQVVGAFLMRLRHLIAQPIADQAVTWLERAFGAAAGVGTVAALDYARTLSESATLLVSQPLGYVVLSSARTDAADMNRRVDAIARPVLALAMPLSAFLLVFAPDIVHLAFGRGAFTPAAELLTTRTLQGISAGMWAGVLGWVLVRLLNVAGRNGRAAAIFVAAYAANALVLYGALPHIAAPGGASLALGAGDGARGLVLLLGTALALGAARTVLGLVLRILPPCIALCLAGLYVQSAIHAGLPRLFVGGSIMVVVAAATLACLMPRRAVETARRYLTFLPGVRQGGI